MGAQDAAIDRAWWKQPSGVQVSVLDILQIYKDVRAAVNGGTATVAEAVDTAIGKYRAN